MVGKGRDKSRGKESEVALYTNHGICVPLACGVLTFQFPLFNPIEVRFGGHDYLRAI